MNKGLGIFALLVFVCAFTAIINPSFIDPLNIQNTLRWTAEFGIIGIGVALVIITGGIDLSLGSVIALVGCLLTLGLATMLRRPPGEALNWTLLGTGAALWLGSAVWLHSLLLRENVRRGLVVIGVPPYAVAWGWRRPKCRRAAGAYSIGVAFVLLGWLLPTLPLPGWTVVALVMLWALEASAAIGLLHGVLITHLRLQPFVVTLCGLLFYRGLARWLTRDQTQGFGGLRDGYEGVRSLAIGRPFIMAWLMLAAAGAAGLWAAWHLLAARRWIGSPPRPASAWDRPSVSWPRTVAPLLGSETPAPEMRHETPVSPWLVLLVAAVLGGAASLHFVQDVAALSAGQPSWTQQVLFWCGLLGAVGASLTLTAVTLRRRQWQPLVAVLLAAAGLAIVSLGTAAERETAAALSWRRVPFVVVGLLAAMTGAAWFWRSAWREAVAVGSSARRMLVLLALASVVLLLTGLTPLDRVETPAPLLVLIAIGALAGFFLNFTIHGRYLLALGRNEEAARYSGINTPALIKAAYVLCALLAGIAGILFALDVNSVQPSVHGNFYELYAIAAAVLGGCSLRGGEGSVFGVIVGTAVILVLKNAISILGIPTQLEFAVIGAVILAGVTADEVLRRLRAR